MKKIALIPDENLNETYENSERYKTLKEYLKDNVVIKLAIRYDDYNEVDWFVYYHIDYAWIERLREKNIKRNIYVAWEPEAIDKRNSLSNLSNLLEVFQYIFTWNEELIDNQRIFKIMMPSYQGHNWNIDTINPFEKRKLLTNISGNKYSDYKKELYSERKKVIDFFEDDSDEFDLYGIGWDKNEKNYKGIVTDKANVYPKYKFALCLENARDLNGYITEKIIDCFVGQVVPVYGGGGSVTKWIPSNCFIDYFRFESVAEMVDYLRKMDCEEWLCYMNEISKFLHSSQIDIFSIKELAKTYHFLSTLNELEDFRIPLQRIVKLKSFYICQRINRGFHLSNILPQFLYRIITKCFTR